MDNIDYYRSQSALTAPDDYSQHYAEVLFDIPNLCATIQGLLLHMNDGGIFDYEIPNSRKNEMNARSIQNMLKIIFELENNHLNIMRAIPKRMIATCRDFAVLACSILRHNKIPSRVRFGFSGYYFRQFFHDIVLLEYWNFSMQRWCLVDVRTTLLQISQHNFNVNFNMHDIPSTQFITAAKAWRQCRNHITKATKFGSGPRREIKGLWYVRNKLMQDLAALNKVEVLPWDCWGYILNNKFGVDPDDPEELSIMDQIAGLLDQSEFEIDALRKIFNHPYLRVNLC